MMTRTTTGRRRLRRAGVIVSAAALGASILPAPVASAATYRTAADGSKIIKLAKVASYQYDMTVASKALGQNVNVRIRIPKGYSRTAKRTWPVLYAFHGGQDNYTSWTRSTSIETTSLQYDVMVVMPEGANGSYTDWYNYGSGGNPRWEYFHLNEVRQLMERNFRAGSSRAAMGISSGAQGAMTYAARYPGLFRYVAAFSGIQSLREPGIPSMLMYMNMNHDIDPFRIWGVPVTDDANWAQHDPKALAARLKGTKLYISSGTTGQQGPLDDPNKAPWDIGYLSESQVGRTNIAFRDELKRLGIPVTTHIYGDGSHSWAYWRREMATVFPTMMKTIGARKF